MGLHWKRRTSCERAARAISLRLDGELPELEEIALERHLAGCPACRAIGAETSGFTRLVREAPLVAFTGRVAVASSGGGAGTRLLRRVTASAAVAATLAAAGAGVIVVSESRELRGEPRGP